MPDSVGSYEIKVNNTIVRFWPLAPGTRVEAAVPPATAPVAPGTPNTLAVPGPFGIFDIAIAVGQDPLVKTTIAAATIGSTITPTPTVQTMPLVPDASGMINICFAVPVTGANFAGDLHLAAMQGTSGTGTARRMKIPLKIAASGRAADLFIFFLAHYKPPLAYAWVKLQAIDQASPATGVGSASGVCKVLRDNQVFHSINREFDLETDAGGFVCPQGSRRNVLGLPLDWPLIMELSKDGFIRRGHLLKLAPADVKDNLAPLVPTPADDRLKVRMMREANAGLASKKIMLDAGHGVVYSYEKARRSQEWYVAHKVCDRVAEKLMAAPFKMPAANIFRTRSAGFGLIEPADIQNESAPESGDARYVFDLPQRRIRARTNSITLKAISDLLLTRHEPDTLAALPVADPDRASIFTASAATFTAIESRLNQQLAPTKRVRPGSIGWDYDKGDYIYIQEPNPPPDPAPVGTSVHLPVSPADWFSLDARHLDILAERSALWSLANEIVKKDEPTYATDAVFCNAVRDTMRKAPNAKPLVDGAVAYMKAAILFYLNVAPPHDWLNYGIKAWGPDARCTYFNATPCDLYLSVHENFGGPIARGGYALVSSMVTGTDQAPPEQIQLAKVFLKYVDAFDQGVWKTGIGFEESEVMMLHDLNTMREKYYYGETEYMDRVVSTSPVRYQIQDMIDHDYVETLASQLVESIVEALLDKQSSMDTITFTQKELTLW